MHDEIGPTTGEAPGRSSANLQDTPVPHEARTRWRTGVWLLVAGTVVAVALTSTVVRLVADQATPTPSSMRLDCPQPSGHITVPAESSGPGPIVPEGGEAALLCMDPHRDVGPSWEWPANGLRLGARVDELIATLNSLEEFHVPGPMDPESGAAYGCPAMDGPVYDLVIGYPDGSTVTVQLDTAGCSLVRAADEYRAGAGHAVEVFGELAEKQRLDEAPATPLPPPECTSPDELQPMPAMLTVVDLRYDALDGSHELVPYPAVAVTLCRYSSGDPANAELLDTAVVTHDPDSLRRMVNSYPVDFECSYSADVDGPPVEGPLDVLVFQDRVGGLFEIRIVRGDCPTMVRGAHLSGYATPKLVHGVEAAYR